MRAFLTLFAGAVAAILLAPAARAEDTAAPVISYSPPAPGTQPKGAFTVSAQITDESKFFPQVFFRYGSSGPYEKPIDMKRSSGSTFEASIPYKTDTISFYIEAYDEYGNGPARAGEPEKPFKLTLGESAAVAATAPVTMPPAVIKPPPARSAAPYTAPPPRPQAPPVASQPPAQTQTVVYNNGPSRTWTWVVGGIGLGALAGGLVAGLAVKTEDDAYKQALAGTPNGNGTTQVNDPASLAAQHDANVKLGTKATILTIAGGVLLAGGVALFFVEPRLNGSSEADSGGSNNNNNGSRNNNGRSNPSSKPGSRQPRQDDGPGFNGSNDAAPAEALPAISQVSVGAMPVQGGGAVALAGHF